MRAQPERDLAFEKFVHDYYGCVAQSRSCAGVLEFAHLAHSGMGGKRVPSYRNGVIMCQFHHTGSCCEAYHKIGRSMFEEIHSLNLEAIANWMANDFDGDFLQMAETPPAGVHRAA